ncbi:MAG: DUF86 domain-containing protein [Muribaculum sp.]|nr:DUF86 domain-containing protein [Muribaculum sp.]
MESQSLHNQELVLHILGQLVQACDLIITWNEGIASEDDYLCSPTGMEKMAATCMLLESIGESAKKIDRLIPGFLTENEPAIPWKQIKGLRDHIAHGYFELDAVTIFETTKEIQELKEALIRLQSCI